MVVRKLNGKFSKSLSKAKICRHIAVGNNRHSHGLYKVLFLDVNVNNYYVRSVKFSRGNDIMVIVHGRQIFGSSQDVPSIVT